MELVCTGLSKNPYMTVEEKKEHIMWYRNYFGDKQKLLKEIGAIDRNIMPEGEANKHIEAWNICNDVVYKDSISINAK